MKWTGKAPVRPVFFIGSSEDDLRDMPNKVTRIVGQSLLEAQLGKTHPSAKMYKAKGGGVFEVVEDYDTDTYRCVYTVRFELAVYVLHVFQKKSKSGATTPPKDVELVNRRLKSAKEHYDDWSETEQAREIAREIDK